MGKIVHKGLDQKTIFDVNLFIPGDRDFKLLELKYSSLFFKFVSPDVAFVKQRVCYPASYLKNSCLPDLSV